jgi:DNA-binding MarR family transcriptional regulator
MNPDRRGRLILPNNIGFLLRMAQLHSFREFERAFAGTGLTPPLLTVLIIMRDNPGVRQRDLATALRVRSPNLTTLIAPLDEAGLISRRIDKTDRRALDMRLTVRGMRLLEAIRPRLEALDGEILKALGPQQRRVLHRYLESILDDSVEVGRRSGT